MISSTFLKGASMIFFLFGTVFLFDLTKATKIYIPYTPQSYKIDSIDKSIDSLIVIETALYNKLLNTQGRNLQYIELKEKELRAIKP